MASTFNCSGCGAPLDYSGSGDTMRCPYCHNNVIVPEELRHPAAAAQTAVGSGEMYAITRLVESGEKIEALKLYRQMTGASLEQARLAVDALQSAVPQPVVARPEPNGSGFTASGLSAEQTALIQRLCAGGQKIEAIKLYRQLRPVGLAEAKAAVEAMAVGCSHLCRGGQEKAIRPGNVWLWVGVAGRGVDLPSRVYSNGPEFDPAR